MKLAALLLLLVAATAAAQGVPSGVAPDSVVPELLPSFGFREGGPTRHSIYWGMHRVGRHVAAPRAHEAGAGPAMLVEAGEGGWQLGVGYGRIAAPYAVARAHLLYLETWGRPRGTTPDQKYAGAELRLSLLGIGVGFVGYRRVYGASDQPPGPPWIGAATAVVGL